MKNRPLVHDGIIEFLDFSLAPATADRKWNFPLLRLTVNVKPVRGLANVAFLTANEGEPEKRLVPLPAPDMAVFTFAPAAETHCFLQLLFFLGAAHFTQPPSYIEIGHRIAGLAPFADPLEQLRRVEKSIAAVNQRRRCAVLEFQIAGITPFPLARFVPDARHRP